MNTKTENRHILSVDYILQCYGDDALEPCFIVTDEPEEETITIPKMRESMSADEWFELPQEFRLFVLRAFYESL
jgi:hypothetical protein